MPKSLKDILKEHQSILENAADTFFGSIIKKVEQSIFKNIKNFIKGLNIKNGKIENDSKNKNLLIELDNRIGNAYKQSGIIGNVQSYLKQFDRIEALDKLIYKKTLKQSEASAITQAFENTNFEKSKIAKDITQKLLNLDVVAANVLNEYRDILFESIVFNRDSAETERLLKEKVISTEGNQSKLLRYTKQIATDSILQYDGALQDNIRAEFELDGFMYSGSLIKTSRHNCTHLINGTGKFAKFRLKQGGLYQVKDLDKIIAAAKSGNTAGLNFAVTPETFARYRLGYNCRHGVIYVRLLDEDLESEELKAELAKESKTFVPTKTLKEAEKVASKKDMIVYRHHNEALEKLMRSSPSSFVIDPTRHYNNVGRVKNEAQLYFYAADVTSAENYKTRGTKLYSYEIDNSLKLLDLRIKKNRAKLPKLATKMAADETALKQTAISDHGESFKKHLNNVTTSNNDVINDVIWSGLTFWGQHATDYENGSLLKKELKSLNYDGIIFQDGKSVEIALLSPAKKK